MNYPGKGVRRNNVTANSVSGSCSTTERFSTFQCGNNTNLTILATSGSGCGAVGRAVASNTRGPRFESSHRQLLLNIYLLLTVCRKDEK